MAGSLLKTKPSNSRLGMLASWAFSTKITAFTTFGPDTMMSVLDDLFLTKVGNIYVNRNMIGAVVGMKPFGGMGLSGTGPKARGPNYLQRFAVGQTVTKNTAAIGGNVTLMTHNLS